jgi:hypothetical protein
MYGLRTIGFRSLAIATLWFAIACNVNPAALNDANSLQGTWVAHAGGFNFRITFPNAQCSSYGCWITAAPGTYTQDATAATGSFAVDVNYYQYLSAVTMDFVDATVPTRRYQEMFHGQIVSSMRMDGVITLFVGNPLSPFHLAEGTALSFIRQ